MKKYAIFKKISTTIFTSFALSSYVFAHGPVINEDQATATNTTTVPTISDDAHPSIIQNYSVYGTISDFTQELVLPPQLQYAYHPTTTILGVTRLNESFTFSINATSPISRVNHFTLEDNRIVIDIYNATANEETIFNGIEGFISGIRIGQQNGFTRVVVDMPVLQSYTINFNYDRTAIYISFLSNEIHQVTFYSTYYSDSITITGAFLPNAVISQFLQESLTITLPLSYLQHSYGINSYTQGTFFENATANQVNNDTVIYLSLHGSISYSTSAQDNSLTITIKAPTYRNIYFNREISTITLLNSENITFTQDNLEIYSYYRSLTHVINLNGDYSHHFGYGTILFFSDVSTTIEVNTYEGVTSIVINAPNITYSSFLQSYEPDYNAQGLTLRTFSPREVYSHIVMLDPGHGGSDPGAIQPDYTESELVLIISNIVYERLQQNPNIGVFTTRDTDVFVSLADRAYLANDVADLFVSVHLNSFTTAVPHGTEVYFLPQENEYRFNITRERTAEIFLNNLVQDLGRVDRGIRQANFAVLRLTDMPSVLLEIGFMSNPYEMQFLANPANHPIIADSIYRSILEVFEIYTPNR